MRDRFLLTHSEIVKAVENAKANNRKYIIIPYKLDNITAADLVGNYKYIIRICRRALKTEITW